MHEAACRRLFDDAVAGLTHELCSTRGWTLVTSTFPILEVGFEAPGRTPFRVRLICDDWNELPPSVLLLDGSGAPLTTLPSSPGTPFNGSAHPTTGRPFVCMVSTREYHTHTSHVGDRWENYRDRAGYELGGILTQLWRAWQAARP